LPYRRSLLWVPCPWNRVVFGGQMSCPCVLVGKSWAILSMELLACPSNYITAVFPSVAIKTLYVCLKLWAMFVTLSRLYIGRHLYINSIKVNLSLSLIK
jgi:hypothetical protein